MIGEAHLRTAINNFRQAITETRAAKDEFRHAIDERRAETDKHIAELNQQISQAEHEAADPLRSDQERTILRQRSQVLRNEIDNAKRQFVQFEQDMHRMVSEKEQTMQQLDNFVHTYEQNIFHGVQ